MKVHNKKYREAHWLYFKYYGKCWRKAHPGYHKKYSKKYYEDNRGMLEEKRLRRLVEESCH